MVELILAVLLALCPGNNHNGYNNNNDNVVVTNMGEKADEGNIGGETGHTHPPPPPPPPR